MNENSSKSSLVKKIVYWVLIILFVLWISNRAADFEKVVELIKSAKPFWIFSALVLEIIYLMGLGTFYNFCIRLVGYKVRYIVGIESFIASLFLSVTTPLGGFGSAVYLARRYAKKMPISIGGISAALLFGMLVFNLCFLIVLIPSFLLLYRDDSPLLTLTTAAGSVFVAVIFVYWVALFFAVKKPVNVKKLFFWLKRFYQKIGRIKESSILTLSDDTLEKNLQDYIITSKALSKGNSKRRLMKVFIYGISLHIFQMVILFTVFNAFGVIVSLKVLLLTYTIFYLFTIVSPTPQGIGFVEGLVQLVLLSLGVNGEASLVITLVYRAIGTWFPVMLGLVMFKKLSFAKNSGIEKVESIHTSADIAE